MDRSYTIRVEALAERARRARCCFLPPENPPDRDRAREYLRDGVGPTVALYGEATMGSPGDSLPPQIRTRLDGVLNDWLELYAGCFGVHLQADATVARAADSLSECHDLRETARKLTGIPINTGVTSRSRRLTMPGRPSPPERE